MWYSAIVYGELELMTTFFTVLSASAHFGYNEIHYYAQYTVVSVSELSHVFGYPITHGYDVLHHIEAPTVAIMLVQQCLTFMGVTIISTSCNTIQYYALIKCTKYYWMILRILRHYNVLQHNVRRFRSVPKVILWV